MRSVSIMSVAVLLTGCAGLVHTGSITEAYKKLDDGNYTETLRLVNQAEAVRNTDADTLAETAYLRAKAYQGLGDNEKAMSLYQYLVEQHPSSQWGYLASTMLD